MFPDFSFIRFLELSLLNLNFEIWLFVCLLLEGFGNFLNFREKGRSIWISIWDWNWIRVKSRIEIDLELNLKVSEVFKKNRFGPPCYLSGFLFLRRCFLWCLQVSSNSSLLFNIVFWSAVRIMSFSVRHRSLKPINGKMGFILEIIKKC